ncbi:MAG: hypothetical protein U9R14_00600, partial [Patescibacteria group bacterium]|nr:hypothetical protein [Patescibacteria group bacterium]
MNIKFYNIKKDDKVLIKLKDGVDGFGDSHYSGIVTQNDKRRKEILITGDNFDYTFLYSQIESIEKINLN